VSQDDENDENEEKLMKTNFLIKFQSFFNKNNNFGKKLMKNCRRELKLQSNYKFKENQELN
jgi:hypothetical protein